MSSEFGLAEWRSKMGAVAQPIVPDALSTHIRTVSFDVFDTALLRHPECESRHLRNLSDFARKALQERLSLEVSADQLWRSRILAQRIAYQMVGFASDRQDTTLVQILRLQCLNLGLPEDAVEILTDAEYAWEVSAVKADRRASALIANVKANGSRVVFTSDIYLPAGFVRKLLDAHGFNGNYDALYISGTEGQTKRAGGLYDVLLEREQLNPCEILHMGDNHRSDYIMARTRGINAVWLPRTRWFRGLRRLSALVMRLGHPD